MNTANPYPMPPEEGPISQSEITDGSPRVDCITAEKLREKCLSVATESFAWHDNPGKITIDDILTRSRQFEDYIKNGNEKPDASS